MKKNQNGFLMMVAVVIIVIFSLLSVALVGMMQSSALESKYLQAIPKADALAESGLEQGRANLINSTIASRSTCAALSNTTAVGTGNFVVTDATNAVNLPNPRYAFTTLSTPISAANVITAAAPAAIVVNDTSVFQASGRVLIGREVFAYNRIINATTLNAIGRAQTDSLATSHVTGELVSQFQCMMDSTGSQPVTAPLAIREYQQSVQQPVLFTASGSTTVPAIYRWNSDASELTWQSLTITTPAGKPLNAISALNYHDAWAVGNNLAPSFFFSRLQGNTWTGFTYTDASGLSAHLNGVWSTSSVEAWAVGDVVGHGANAVFSILRWTRNGTNTNNNWCLLSTASGCGGVLVDVTGTSSTARYLYSIETRDTNGDGIADAGYAAGGKEGVNTNNSGVVMSFNGTTWAKVEIGTGSDNVGVIKGLAMTPNGTSEVFFTAPSANGSNTGVVARLRSGVWSFISNITGKMNAVSVIDYNGDGVADFGCAVGDGGRYVFFTGASTFAATTNALVGDTNPNLIGVSVITPTDIWAVGASGARFHYDGSTWTSITTGVATANQINGISAVFPPTKTVGGDITPMVTGPWTEVIN